MFTFIKRIQELLSQLKKNKGLWFTTITTVSLIGIFICLYIVMTMTSRVSEEVYKSITKTYDLNLNSKIDDKKIEFQKIALTLQDNGELLNFITANDEEGINNLKNKLNEKFLQNGHNNFSINIITTLGQDKKFRNIINSVITTKNSFFGTEVLNTDTFYIYLAPILQGDTVAGVIEVKESIHNFKESFKKENMEFVFLLDKKMLPYLLPEARNGIYKDASPLYSIDQTRYDTKFALSISEIEDVEFNELFSKKYIVKDNYFRTVSKVSDVNGVDIGIILAGESTDIAGAFVKIADEMTNTVTTVALGLMISIILFLF